MQPSSGGSLHPTNHVYCSPPPPRWHPTPSRCHALFVARIGRQMMPPICLASFNNKGLSHLMSHPDVLFRLPCRVLDYSQPIWSFMFRPQERQLKKYDFIFSSTTYLPMTRIVMCHEVQMDLIIFLCKPHLHIIFPRGLSSKRKYCLNSYIKMSL